MKLIETITWSRLAFNPITKGVAGLGISAAFVALALRGVDLDQVRSHFRGINTSMFIPVLFCLIGIFLLRAFRCQYLMSPIKRITFARSFSVIVIGFMANNAIPLRGGDLLRSYLLGRQERIGTTAVLTTVALERVFDALSLATTALLVLWLSNFPGWLRYPMIVLVTMFLGGAVCVIAFRSGLATIEALWRWVRYRLPGRLQGVISMSIQQVRLGLKTAQGKVRLTNLYLLAVTESVLWWVMADYSFQIIGVHVPLVAILSTSIATNLTVILPLSPGNIGVFEYAVMATLQFYIFNRSVALSSAVVLHVIHVIPGSLVGLIFFIGMWLMPKPKPKGIPK